MYIRLLNTSKKLHKTLLNIGGDYENCTIYLQANQEKVSKYLINITNFS